MFTEHTWPAAKRAHRDAHAQCCYITTYLQHVGRESLATAILANLLSPYRVPGEGNGSPLQSSCLENPMDGGAW